uniref:Dolichol-phosphate mannosyltransferase subunit 1 n=1 Tax=Chromera velia CCMP2878 TaxID=1169474 RepID=A0A0G4GI01_9ALVE|eukprot:Cvel_21980.t1-p1 / transcript=Cvel_21980.t1 / gene=Cvel_21980 / organism=Chromera_velia_CCMP2878 / gene_product=Dolichol-phosphate mannosyltransferase, putative / transcript_product=Dolichol-phosphate mannosyltransferase, putative / location=Cvel_scaffold2115:30529-32665(+) / protein_length=257 / sequence_SO=supercontig / SO=protein_coding / is_pseudo=false
MAPKRARSKSSDGSRKGEKAKYSVILPTYNERDNIALMIWLLMDTLDKANADYEIVVVDDNSPDGTADVFRQLQKAYPKAPLILHQRPGKLGLGTAYIDGAKVASGNFIFLMDCDMSHNPRDLPKFIQKQKETKCDIVTGSRYIPGGGVCGWDLRRVFTSVVANYLAHVMLNPRTSDLTGSFRLFKRQVFDSIIPQVKSRGYVFQMEIISRARAGRMSVEEVPIIFVDRIYGQSKLGTGEIVQYLQGLWRLFWTLSG